VPKTLLKTDEFIVAYLPWAAHGELKYRVFWGLRRVTWTHGKSPESDSASVNELRVLLEAAACQHADSSNERKRPDFGS